MAHTLSKVVIAAGILAAAALPAGAAHAGGLNDWSCHPAPGRPYPVVLVHGRGGDIDGFGSLVAALRADGRCVYATNYGQVGGQGQHGVDHLWVSGAQLDAFVDQVLTATGAARVDLIGHSAGTGVIDNLVLARGAEHRIHRVVSFGGLHHPYAHAGAAGFEDNDLYLPNLIAAARLVVPGITAQQVIVNALALYTVAGGALAGVDAETATSNFASDLFDPVYWAELHGGPSEPPTTFIRLATDGRSLATHDASRFVCYSNLVGIADVVTGPSAGFQDDAPNVDNFVLPTSADHAQLLTDPVALTYAIAALSTACPYTEAGVPDDPDADGDPGAPGPDAGVGDPDGDGAGNPDDPGAGGTPGGCAVGGGGGGGAAGAGLVLALGALLGLARRRHGATP
ncbi:MAG: alpha/beta hydrolase [Kofleriaceae bacterium]|nr:alpha/beta hydrolase [Kofleriaceae bacterium]